MVNFVSILFDNIIHLLIDNNYPYRKEIIVRYKKFVVIIRNLNTMKFASRYEYLEYCKCQRDRFIFKFILFLIRHCLIIFLRYMKEKNNLSNTNKNIKEISIIKPECVSRKSDFIFEFSFNNDIEKKAA